MNQQLHATLAHPVLGIPAQLQPLLAHFSEAGSPRSVTGWLTGMPGGRLLAALAATAHRRELTHALLDEQPQTPALHHVRDMLVQAGVLPPRDEYLERIRPWLGEILAGRPAHHAALVRPYATWHVLRRARRRFRRRGASTMSAAGWAAAESWPPWRSWPGSMTTAPPWAPPPRPTSYLARRRHPLPLPAAGLPYLGQRPPPGRPGHRPGPAPVRA